MELRQVLQDEADKWDKASRESYDFSDKNHFSTLAAGYKHAIKMIDEWLKPPQGTQDTSNTQNTPGDT